MNTDRYELITEINHHLDGASFLLGSLLRQNLNETPEFWSAVQQAVQQALMELKADTLMNGSDQVRFDA